MYYLAWTFEKPETAKVCYAESKDGIHWVKPKLGICEWDGNREYNIIMDSRTLNSTVDNFMVFKNTNPLCEAEKRYKAVCRVDVNGAPMLYCYYSSDAIHFERGNLITDNGAFDTLNVAFYDEVAEIYRCYFRGWHIPGNFDEFASNQGNEEEFLRDIRYIESADFINWTKPRLINLGNSEDVALYTNLIQPYCRAKHILIGFPTRYIYRREWTDNYERLCGKEARRKRMETLPRFGLAVTDCAFIVSDDGRNFKKYDEAFIRPEPECGTNWIYGDCYPARGLIETPSDIKGADAELSMYMPDEHTWSAESVNLARYTIRCDGFVSMHAGEKEKTVVTKPFIFDGDKLYVNFATSALGYMYFTVVDEDGNKYESCEIFGNKTDRIIDFKEGVLKNLSGKPATLEVRMRNADLYSIKFDF